MKPSSHSDNEGNQLARYQILMQHRQHIERVFWSRIQTLHLLQAAVIGGSFYLYQTDSLYLFSLPLLGLGFILTVLLLILCLYDWKNVDVNKKRIFSLGDTLGITWSAQKLKIFGFHLTAHRILYVIVGLFILVDLGLFIYFIFKF